MSEKEEALKRNFILPLVRLWHILSEVFWLGLL